VNIIDYTTAGGKNMTMDYIDDLPKKERAKAYRIRQVIAKDGILALEILETRQLKGKLWEINSTATE